MPWSGIIDFSVWSVLTTDGAEMFNFFFSLVGVFGFITFCLTLMFKVISRS